MGKKEVSQAALSARAFYFITFGLFYFTCFWYPNDLALAVKNLQIVYLATYFGLHILSIYLFLTAGKNPGYAKETDTPQSIKDKTKMFVGYDQFKEVDDISNLARSTQSPPNRNTYKLESDLEQNSILSDTQSEDTLRTTEDTVKSIEFVAKVKMPKKKFCEYCSIEMPYRSKHCKDCEKCVRKFDHHCFWVGGCVGELNHRKFWCFLFFQTIQFFYAFDVAMSGYTKRETYTKDFDERNHIASVWIVFLTLTFLFILFTGILLLYHSYLILSGQTTWEHSRRTAISYLKIYPVGTLPFYKGMWGNIKQTFWHQGKCVDWELKQPYELREIQGFNFCENEYYSCC